MKEDVIKTIFLVIAGTLMLGYAACWMIFQWRNPKANAMTFWREPGAVLRLQKLPEYQK